MVYTSFNYGALSAYGVKRGTGEKLLCRINGIVIVAGTPSL